MIINGDSSNQLSVATCPVANTLLDSTLANPSSRVELLNHELTREMHVGRLAQAELVSNALMTFAGVASPVDILDRVTLISKSIQGAQATQKLFESNKGLINFFAQKYRNHVPLEDLVQTGAEALTTATIKFNYENGTPFGMYASTLIKYAMMRYVDSRHTIRLSETVIHDLNLVNEVEAILLTEGKYATTEIIAKRSGLTPQRVQRIRGVKTMNISSLDISTNDLDPLAERLADNNTSLIDQIDETQSAYHANQLLSLLEERERMLLKLRFGYDGQTPKILEEISPFLGGLSREAVRQIEEKALTKLRRVDPLAEIAEKTKMTREQFDTLCNYFLLKGSKGVSAPKTALTACNLLRESYSDEAIVTLIDKQTEDVAMRNALKIRFFYDPTTSGGYNEQYTIRANKVSLSRLREAETAILILLSKSEVIQQTQKIQNTGSEAERVRAWAARNRIKVGSRGLLSKELIENYRRATSPVFAD